MNDKSRSISSESSFGPLVQDWSQFVSFKPSLYFRPKDLSELKDFLAGLFQGIFKQSCIRTLGSLHSCSDIYVSDAIIDVSSLPKVLEFNGDSSMVTVSANWSLHDFLLELSRRGKSLNATGGTDPQTLAGLISTNTAPATPKYSLYDLVEWIEYLTVNENDNAIVEKHVTKTDPEFPAVVGSLGAIGILTKAQFRVVDELFFKTIQKVVPLDQVLGDLDATSEKYDFWRVNWVPDTSDGLLWAAKSIPKDQAEPDGDYETDKAESLLEFIFKFWDRIRGGAVGPLLDDAMRGVYRIIAGVYNINTPEATGPLRNMLPVDRRAPLHVAMAEWSFKPADLNVVMQLCKEYFERNGWPNIPTEIELTKTDKYFMSPWNWEGLDYIVKFNFMYLTEVCQTDAEKELINTHLKGLWEYLLKARVEFKAHWGKINFMDYNFVKSHYRIDQFAQHIRPAFLNRYLKMRLTQ